MTSVFIERLVIDEELARGHRVAEIERALRGELTRLVEHEGMRAESGSTPSIVAPGLPIPQSVTASDLGRRIARTVFDSLQKTL